MKIKIIYKVGKMEFEATADSIAEAYEYVKAIVDKEDIDDPFTELNQYMIALVDIEMGELLNFEGKIIKFEVLDPTTEAR